MPRVVARVNNPNNEWMFNEMWGVDVSVSTPHLITGLVQEAVDVGSLVRLLSFQGGKARLAEVTLAEGSPAADREIVELGFPARPLWSLCFATIASSFPAATPCCAPATRSSCSSRATASRTCARS